MSTARLRPGLRRFAIVAFAILLPIAAHSLWDYIEVRRLVEEIEKIRAKGEPVTEREAAGVDEPAPSNQPGAADYYLAGAMLALGARSYDVTNPVREWLAAPAPDRAQLPQLARPLDQFVATTHDAVVLADKATPLPFTRLTAGTNYSYRTAGLSALSGAIASRTLRASIAGNGDVAVDSAITGLRLRRALRSGFGRPDGDFVDAVLSLATPSADALRRLDAALAERDLPELRHANFLEQRASYVERIWRQAYGSDASAPRQITLPARTPWQYLARPLFTHRLVEQLRTWAELVEVSKGPWAEKTRTENRLREESRGQSPTSLQGQRMGDVFVSPAVAYGSFAQAIDATPLILDRCARIAVAIERFKIDRKNSPAALADLVPAYLNAIPEDPYSGQPLMFTSTANSYTIYSVGTNLKDDGGDLTSEMQSEKARFSRTRPIRGQDVGLRILTTEITKNK